MTKQENETLLWGNTRNLLEIALKMDYHSQDPGSQCLPKTEDRAIDNTITEKKKIQPTKR